MSGAVLHIYWALLICGVLLLGAEIYVPGGILGTIGAIALIGAVLLGSNFGWIGGTLSAVGIVVLAAFVVYLWIRVFPRTPAGRRLTLAMDGRAFKLDDATERAEIGQEGVAQSALWPAGIGLVQGRRCDVITRSVWVDAGRRFRVIGVEGTRLIVEPLDDGAPAEPAAS